MTHQPPSSTLLELSRLLEKISLLVDIPVQHAGKLIWNSFRNGGKLLACGNGGSAADAQHFVAELVGRMAYERQALPAITLNTDPSVVTALSNDYGFEYVFSRQVEALGNPGDVLLGLSTSGYSANILQAFKSATNAGLRTIGLIGAGGDPVFESCDVCIRVPSENTQRIQEVHTALLHVICEQVELHAVSLTNDLVD